MINGAWWGLWSYAYIFTLAIGIPSGFIPDDLFCIFGILFTYAVLAIVLAWLYVVVNVLGFLMYSDPSDPDYQEVIEFLLTPMLSKIIAAKELRIK